MADMSIMEPSLTASEAQSQSADSDLREVTTENRSTLMGLPRELRDGIIKEALIQDQNYPNFIAIGDQKNICGLLPVSKQLRSENLPLFYEKKTFCVYSLNKITSFEHDTPDQHIFRTERWLRAIQSHLPKVKTIRFCLCDTHLTFLEFCATPGKQVTFDLFEYWGGPYGVDRQSYLKMNPTHRCAIGFYWIDSDEDRSDLEEALRDICSGVGEEGFGPEEYIRALKLFLDPIRSMRY